MSVRYKENDYIVVIRNRVNALHPSETRYVETGDVLEVIGISPTQIGFNKDIEDFAIVYRTKHSTQYLPFCDIEMYEENDAGKCKCSLLTFELYGCQCGKIIG